MAILKNEKKKKEEERRKGARKINCFSKYLIPQQK
jgi:hypothetical protein